MSDADRDSRVSRRAYELWEQEGGEHGRHEDHWHRAAGELDEQASVAAPDGTTLDVPAEVADGGADDDAAAADPAPAQTGAKAKAAKAPAKPRKPKTK